MSPISPSSSDWRTFGDYMSGIVGTIATIIACYLVYDALATE